MPRRTGIKRPGKKARLERKRNAPTGSVWNWLKRPSVGDLSKEEIDSYIRSERESWGAR